MSNCDLCRLVLKQVERCQEPSPVNVHGVPLCEFWIMKREKGGDGFWVMSLTDEMNEVAVVAAIGFCVRDGDPLESTIRGRPVEQHGGTLTAMSRVQQWVIECDEHPSCSPGETQLPSRVIDVGVSNNSPHGLFGERPAREYVELEHTSDNLRGQALAFALPLDEEVNCPDYIFMRKEPLSDRAWCLQERVGSSRTVLYGSTQLFFECNEGFQGEDGLFLKDRFESVKILEQRSEETEQYRLEDGVNSGRVSSKKLDILRSWQKLVALYGERKLTYASDKLPAISGLATVFARLLDDEYVAGLWRSHLIEGLLWEGFPRRVQEYRSPSWSWASTDGRTGLFLTQDHYTDHRILAKVLNISVDLKGANPYGEVTNASIEMRAPMERLYIETEGWDPHMEYLFRMEPKVKTANGTFKGTRATFDFDWSAEDGPQEVLRIVKSLEGVDTFALILAKATMKDGGKDYYGGLIVAKVNSGENYQRLGTISFKNEALGKKPEERPEGEFRTIVLI
ncbi:Ff.00g062010.m01.CDS01 [Fusarium sp. VM40]|nr:Ff.00g062010.m01.CDS01 [Fusarium sp. VM40]